MGNVTDQFFIFFVKFQFLFCRILQTFAHVFQIPAELSELVICLNRQFKVKISFFYTLCCLPHLPDRSHDTSVNPDDQHTCGKYKYQENAYDNLHEQTFHFRNQASYICHNKCTAFTSIRILKINLF